VSGPVTSVARVEDVQIFLKDPVFPRNYMCPWLTNFSCIYLMKIKFECGDRTIA